MFTISDGKHAYEQLAKALLEIDAGIEVPDNVVGETEKQKDNYVNEVAVSQIALVPLSKAWDMDWEEIPLCDAVGRAVGEFINLYPPGVPLLVPGEILQKEHYEQLTVYKKQGLTIQGVEAQAPFLIKVLKVKEMR